MQEPIPEVAGGVLASISGAWPVRIDPDPKMPLADITGVLVPISSDWSFTPQSGPWQGASLPIVAVATLADAWLSTVVVVAPPGESWQVVAGQVDGHLIDLTATNTFDGVPVFPLDLRLNVARVVRMLASAARHDEREALLARLGDLAAQQGAD